MVQVEYQNRHSNKEPEWSSICDNVFDQYLDTDDLFGFDANQHGRCSSNDSVNLFDFSASSGQSHRTDATSPVPPWRAVGQQRLIEARQPIAKEPVTFWTKTLRALEQNAAECENEQLRSTKSHPDFLSLGGCPSPPAVPSSPIDQSFSAQRRVSRSAANGAKRNVTARSVSRGRPSGVIKTAVAGAAKPYATVRKCSASPPKMMNPSRYRAGFKDVWTDKLHLHPNKYELRVPPLGLPVSPTPSARLIHGDDYAAFSSPSHYPPVPSFDDQMSPLTTTFQQAHIHTPGSSPSRNDFAHARNSYVSIIPPLPPNIYDTQTGPLNDTAPLYPERTSSLATSNIQAFDFGFSGTSPTEAWNTGPVAGKIDNYGGDFALHDPFASLGNIVLPSIETADTELSGLGIGCDPSLVSNNQPLHPATASEAKIVHDSAKSRPYSLQIQSRKPPTTPHRRAKSCQRSVSPSPTPATEPREPRSSKRATSSRRTSRHRRAKSTNATPRQPRASDKQAGFVNFTAHDSTKILSGVAPSGSSKTKARREKEAADNRRRFSRAAVKAVVEAGGDVDALNKVGLLT